MNTAVKVDQNRLMSERSPDALERVIARVAQLVQEEKDQEKKESASLTLDVTPARGPTITEEVNPTKNWSAFERINAAGIGQQPAAGAASCGRRSGCSFLDRL